MSKLSQSFYRSPSGANNSQSPSISPGISLKCSPSPAVARKSREIAQTPRSTRERGSSRHRQLDLDDLQEQV